MALVCIELRSLRELTRQEIKPVLAPCRRQVSGPVAQQAAYRRRQPAVVRAHLVREIRRVAREKFVSPVSPEGNGHVLPGKAAQQKRGKERTIAQRFFEPRDQFRQKVGRAFQVEGVVPVVRSSIGQS